MNKKYVIIVDMPETTHYTVHDTLDEAKSDILSVMKQGISSKFIKLFESNEIPINVKVSIKDKALGDFNNIEEDTE